jgi:hypothetical protein
VPLTPSHAAAALLLRRIDPRLPFSALVVGALAPDFEYILRLAPRGSFAHSLPGLLLFCLPASFVVWLGYDRVIRPAVADLFPGEIASKLKFRPPVSIVAVLVALTLGALSHIIWDGFTHRTGFFVQRFGPLRARVLPEFTADLQLYTVLQHSSTAAGALLLMIAASHWIRKRFPTPPRYAPREATRATLVLVLLLLAVTGGAVLNGARAFDRGVAATLGYAAVGAMAGFTLALFGYSLAARRPAP